MRPNRESHAAQAIRETEQELERLSSLTSDEIRILREHAAREFAENPTSSESETNVELKVPDNDLPPATAMSRGHTSMIVPAVLTMMLISAGAFCAPIEAVEAATEQAIQHGGQRQPFYVWCLRIAVAASIGAVTYHFITMLIKKALRSTQQHGHEAELPVGSVWKSDNDTTKLKITNADSCAAVLAHRWVSDDRLEQWEVRGITVAGGMALNDFTGSLVCRDHNGPIGTLLIHRGSRNDLSLRITFFDPAVNTIETVVHRA